MIVVYFNRSFSATSHHIQALRQAWSHGALKIIISHSTLDLGLQRVADHFEIEPEDLDDQSYLDYILKICSTYQVNVFYPRKRAELLVKYQEHFRSLGVKVAFVGSAEVYELFDHKISACDALEMQGMIASPARAFVQSYEEFLEAYEKIRNTPLNPQQQHETVCLKPNIGIGGKGFMKISHHRSETEDLFRDSLHSISFSRLKRDLENLKPFPELLLSTYLEGEEYSIDCLAYQGCLYAAYPRFYVSKHEQRFDHLSDLIELCRKICTHYHLSYHFNVQVKKHYGCWYFIELNTRWAAGSHRITSLGVVPLMASLELLTIGHTTARLEIEWGRSVLRQETYFLSSDSILNQQ